MKKLVIKPLKNLDKLPWKLLISADPSKKLVEEYIQKSEIYVAEINDKIVGEFVLTKLSSGVIELKNIAVDDKYQGQGIGKQLVLDAIKKVRDKGARSIEVGTGNSSLSQLALYQKCGVRIIGIEKDYFTKHYSEEIIENGIRCADMIRLSIDL